MITKLSPIKNKRKSVLTSPHSNVSIVARCSQSRPRNVPNHSPYRTMMLVEIRSCLNFKASWCRRLSERILKTFISTDFWITSRFTYWIGFRLIIEMSLLATANMWKLLPTFGAKHKSWTGSVTDVMVSVLFHRLLSSLYSNINTLGSFDCATSLPA